VDARLRGSEEANNLLRAEIATHRRSLELYQTKVLASNQLQAQVTGLTAEVSRLKHDAAYSQSAYRGIQVQYDDLRVQHLNALNHGKGLHEQIQQSQSRCMQAEERSRVLETELVRLKQKMKEAREALDDNSL
jgi:chromosome segregation ATPase